MKGNPRAWDAMSLHHSGKRNAGIAAARGTGLLPALLLGRGTVQSGHGQGPKGGTGFRSSLSAKAARGNAMPLRGDLAEARRPLHHLSPACVCETFSLEAFQAKSVNLMSCGAKLEEAPVVLPPCTMLLRRGKTIAGGIGPPNFCVVA